MSNPFDSEHVDAWSDDVADVESLNASVSDSILTGLETVRRDARQAPTKLKSQCLLVLGPAGAGKTHLFARLRRRSGPRAAFVLLRPEVGTEPTTRHVLAAAVDALRHKPANHDETQLDILVGAALALQRGHGSRFPTAHLDELRNASDSAREQQISDTVDAVAKHFPEIDETWLQRLLTVPTASPVQRRALLTWLSGREPEQLQLERLGLKEPMPDSSVLPALKTLAIIAAQSTPLVLMFDQLENLVQDDETTSRITAYSTLISELYDSVRGLVILQMALDGEWQQRISPALAASHRSRLERDRQLLSLPTEQQRSELIDAWTRALPASERKPPPWPLSDKEWQVWGKGPGVTPRTLMVACREALARGDAPATVAPPPEEPSTDALDTRLDELWKAALVEARVVSKQATDETRPIDRERVLGGLVGALRLSGAPPMSMKSGKQPHDLRLGDERSGTDLYVIQQGNGRSAAASMQKAATAAQSRRVVALREASRPVPSSWAKCLDGLSLLQQSSHGQWVELSPNEVNDLLALSGLLASARSQDLSGRDGKPIPESEVHDWVKRRLEPRGWPAVASILTTTPRDASAASSAGAVTPPPKTPAQVPLPMASDGSVPGILRRLRLASVDRLVREARLITRDRTRAEVLTELRALGGDVRWFGRSIVQWVGGAR
jgi:hypothetical protein